VSRLSNNFFFAAILLALFGVAAMKQGGPYGGLEVLLGVAMAGAGVGLRTGAREAWWFGVGTSALTVAVGAWLLVEASFYVPGTIIAIFALLQLLRVRPVVRPAIPLPAMAPPAEGNDPFGGRLTEYRD
jgi:hypothetical protein